MWKEPPSAANVDDMVRIETNTTIPDLAIPFRHTTAAENLLVWPIIKQQERLSQIDIQYPLQVELSRTPLHDCCHSSTVKVKEALEGLTFQQMTRLTEFYFDDFNEQSHSQFSAFQRRDSTQAPWGMGCQRTANQGG
jgi:hypothetical protein